MVVVMVTVYVGSGRLQSQIGYFYYHLALERFQSNDNWLHPSLDAVSFPSPLITFLYVFRLHTPFQEAFVCTCGGYLLRVSGMGTQRSSLPQQLL